MLNKFQNKYKTEQESKNTGHVERPEWLKIRLSTSKNYLDVNNLIRNNRLNTVCEEARCPNLGECWNNRTATFMILGDTCTRSCGFCAVKTGIPEFLDIDEPRRIAEAVSELQLKHCVITSVNRDELDDGGAGIYKETIRLIREKNPDCSIEILIPDFKGIHDIFNIIMEYPPDILNHNIETVERLYPYVRPQAKLSRSLELIKWFHDNGLRTKSGIMVGIGETNQEVYQTLDLLFDNKCDIVTIGQYLQPTKLHLPVVRYVTPGEFNEFKEYGLKKGFKHVESAPLVRSSYHAEKQVFQIEK